jgi:hypothetical protein
MQTSPTNSNHENEVFACFTLRAVANKLRTGSFLGIANPGRLEIRIRSAMRTNPARPDSVEAILRKVNYLHIIQTSLANEAIQVVDDLNELPATLRTTLRNFSTRR